MSREVVRLSPRERELLLQYYDFYHALATGSRGPTTDAQRHFVAACRGEVQPTSAHEAAWLTFRRIMAHTAMREQEVVEDGFRLEVVIDTSEAAPDPAVPAEPAPLAREVDLCEFEEYGEGVPTPGWFTDEGWRRMRGGYRFDSR